MTDINTAAPTDGLPADIFNRGPKGTDSLDMPKIQEWLYNVALDKLRRATPRDELDKQQPKNVRLAEDIARTQSAGFSMGLEAEFERLWAMARHIREDWEAQVAELEETVRRLEHKLVESEER